MRVLKVVSVDADQLAAVALTTAKQTLVRLMNEVGLPEAQERAPGTSLPSRIAISPIRVVGNGKYRIGLTFPGKYRAVEYGSGIYAGEPSQIIKPKKARALQLPFGYFKSVVWIGQEAKPFATPALEHVAELFPSEFANDLNSRLSRSSARKATKR